MAFLIFVLVLSVIFLTWALCYQIGLKHESESENHFLSQKVKEMHPDSELLVRFQREKAPKYPTVIITILVVLIIITPINFIVYAHQIKNSYDTGISVGYEKSNEDSYQSGYEQGYENGFDEGHNEGETYGYYLGYDDAFVEKNTAYDDGHDDGYQEGYLKGYNAGVIVGKGSDSTLSQRIEEIEKGAHASGYEAGYDAGYYEGYEEGHRKGYNAGVSVGKGYSDTTSQNKEEPKKDTGYSSSSSPSTSQSYSVTVYVTKTGSKYHRSTCSYLRQSKIAISLDSAKSQGYTACSRCY